MVCQTSGFVQRLSYRDLFPAVEKIRIPIEPPRCNQLLEPFNLTDGTFLEVFHAGAVDRIQGVRHIALVTTVPHETRSFT